MNYKEALVSFLKQNRRVITKAAVGIAILMAALFFYLYESQQAGEITVTDENPAVITAENEIATSPQGISLESVDIIIDIGGAVAKPGVVNLKEGERVCDAVEKAGGLTSEADSSQINLAEKLTDGDKVWIPLISETTSEKSTSSKPTGKVSSAIVSSNVSAIVKNTASSQESKVNLNTADTQTLQTLSGVGPSTAEKIINYRETSGGFKTIEDLKNVSGIGDKTFEKLKEFIVV